MTIGKWIGLALVVLGLSVPLVFASFADAQHESSGGTNLAQNYISHPDATLAAAASPTPVLSANANRVTAICVDTGGTNNARVGDASIGQNAGTLLPVNGAPVALDATSALYAYSQAGTTVNCGEVVRP